MLHSSRSGPCPNRGKAGRVWCAYCYANLKGRTRYKGHRGYRAYVYVGPTWSDDSMRKPEKRPQSDDYPRGCSDASFSKRYPHLLMYLSETKWDDGTARVPSSFTVFLEGGMVKVALNDKDGQRSLYSSSETLQGALDAIEGHLASDTGDWRAWNSRTKKGGK